MTALFGVVLLVHAAATWAMTGLIWFIQAVHYPLVGAVGVTGSTAYHNAHSRLTTLVVVPLMLVVAVCAIWIALERPSSLLATWLSVGLLVFVSGAASFVSVPRS
ncbi:MAG: hypothetical protein KA371_09095 [Acidobacteria bacterium]|nr:hypothetical protein [Acidobacteriota bacterium]